MLDKVGTGKRVFKTVFNSIGFEILSLQSKVQNAETFDRAMKPKEKMLKLCRDLVEVKASS